RTGRSLARLGLTIKAGPRRPKAEADRHVLEKSDCAVVPVNQLNKGGQPSAEAGEGMAKTRENIVQSHMHPTQSAKCMSQGLDGVRKAARERKQGQRCGCEFPWACGPPMEMKAALPRPIDSKWVKARLSTEFVMGLRPTYGDEKHTAEAR